MPPRSKPHTLEWPISAEQLENIDTMLQELYDDVRNGSLTIDASQITSGIIPIARGGTGRNAGSAGALDNAFTSGSVIFVAGAPGVDQRFEQDNANFYWDDTNNRLGIGTNVPSADLTIKAAGLWGFLGRGFYSAPADGILLMTNAAQTGFTRLDFGGTTASHPAIQKNSTNLEFKLADNSAYTQIDYGVSGVHGDVFFIADATYDIGPSNANRPRDINISRAFKAGTDITAIGQFIATGGQVAFPATQVASGDANTLDDYEEGTWTPTIIGTTSSSGQTYTTQNGRYTKIGRLVAVDCNVVLSNKGTITGDVAIGGLPFTPGGDGAGNGVYFSAMTTNVNYIVSYVGSGAARINLAFTTAAATGVVPLAQADLSNTTQFFTGAVYTV